MRNITFVTCFVLFFMLFVGFRIKSEGQTITSVPEPEWIRLKDNSREINCLKAYPIGKDKATGVIIVHEEWGLTDWIKSFAQQLATEGYFVAVPDLLSGITPQNGGTRELMNEYETRHILLNSNTHQIISALDAVFNYLDSNSSCNGKIVIIGFSWGGNQAFQYLTHNSDLLAGFIFYSESPRNLKELNQITSPVYGFYGEYDSRINISIGNTERKMKKLGKRYEPVIFEGGGHGFMRSGERFDTHEGNIKARTAAWKRLTELLSVL